MSVEKKAGPENWPWSAKVVVFNQLRKFCSFSDPVYSCFASFITNGACTEGVPIHCVDAGQSRAVDQTYLLSS
jgi:hypothetical protein